MLEQEKLAALGVLAAGIAHEINNPMAYVTSNVRALSRDLGELGEGAGLGCRARWRRRGDVRRTSRRRDRGDTRRHQHGDVLVVTHGGVIQAALHRIVGRPPQGIFPFKIQNASISLIEKRDSRMVIGGVNDVAHLEAGLVTEVGPA